MAEDITWLNDIGSGSRAEAEAGNATAKLSNTAKALVELADILITTANTNADRSASIATGKIVSSMEVGAIEATGTKIELPVMIDPNYKWTDKGVRGTESGKSLAGFAFKTKFANKKMATEILKWLRTRGNAGRIKYSAVSSNEAKNKGVNKTINSAKRLKSLAYAVAVNIKKKGIKPTQWFTNAVKEMEKVAPDKLGDAVKLDIIESLKNL